MNHALLLAAATVLAGGTAALTTTLLAPTAGPLTPATDPEILALRGRVDDLKKELDEVRARPNASVAEAAAGSTERVVAPAVTETQIDEAVRRWFVANGSAAATLSDGGAKQAGVDVATSLKGLRGKSDYWSNAELYKKLFEAGLMDELIEEFEIAAEGAPGDPQAQMDLGNAYLAHLQLDQSKWPLSQKADAAFDKVLAIDEHHWSARFTKAMSYTFWPDFLGKKKEAISHFERLVAQQDTMPVQGHEANTYVFLGNLLEQRGETDKARATWERGLRRHPDDAQLRQKLGR
jgi:tetratricopeptide (TPR) repeat protein